MMTREKIASLIQINMENFWKKMAKTQCADIYETDVALYMDSRYPDPIFNSVIRFTPKDADFEMEREKIKQYYTSKNAPYCWWTVMPSNGSIDRLSEQVIAEGFTDTLHVKGMAMNIESYQWSGFMPEGIEVVQVETSKQVSDWMIPINASFDMIPEIQTLYVNIMNTWLKQSNDLLSYVMYFRGHPVSSFSVFFDKNVSSFYNVATLPRFRKKRISSAIAACCLELSRQKKYKWVTLQASPYSVKLFERLGFRTYIDYVLRFKS